MEIYFKRNVVKLGAGRCCIIIPMDYRDDFPAGTKVRVIKSE